MARKANLNRVRKAAKLLWNHPGHKAGEYAHMMGCHRETFNRLLVLLNDRGILLSEDTQGRLWPFRKTNRTS